MTRIVFVCICVCVRVAVVALLMFLTVLKWREWGLMAHKGTRIPNSCGCGEGSMYVTAGQKLFILIKNLKGPPCFLSLCYVQLCTAQYISTKHCLLL